MCLLGVRSPSSCCVLPPSLGQGKITLHDVKILVFVFYLISVHLELGMC